MPPAAEEIECRCDRRHPLGTEWCSCGAYLPHDGRIVAAVVRDPSAGSDAASPVVERPAAAFEPTQPIHPAESVGRDAAFEPFDDVEATPAFAMVQHAAPVAAAYEPGIEQDSFGGASPFDERTPMPDDLICPDSTCHVRNEATRSFCRRCGLRLREETSHQIEVELPWWRRLWARVTGRDLRSSAENVQYQMYRAKGLTGRARMFRSAAFAGVLAAAGLGLTPAIRTGAVDRVKDLTFADRYSFVDVANAESSADAVPGWEPELAFDGTFNRAWGVSSPLPVTTLETIAIDTSCRSQAGLPDLVFTFVEASDIDRLKVWGGTWENDESRALLPRPRVLQLQAVADTGPGSCSFVELEDTPDAQSVSVKIDDALQVVVTVLSAYPGDESNNRVAISELWFERER